MSSRSSLFLVILCLLACLVVQSHSALSSDQQLYAILNLSISTLRSNGKLGSILAKYSADDIGLNCTSSLQDQTSWPAATELGTAMKQIISTGTIRFCRSETLTKTYFNMTSGLEYDIGKEIASMITSQYGKTVEVSWQRLATKTAGFFPTVLDALNLNTCDAGFGSIAITADRVTQANFTCPYVNTYSAYLQGPRNLSLDLPTLNDLNQTGLIIAALPGTVYGNMAASLTKATFLSVADTTSGMQAAANGVASVFIGDYAFFNSISCPGCKAYKYGTPTQLGILTRQISSYPRSAGEMLRISSWLIVVVFMIALLL